MVIFDIKINLVNRYTRVETCTITVDVIIWPYIKPINPTPHVADNLKQRYQNKPTLGSLICSKHSTKR